jgi:hypothetical protein
MRALLLAFACAAAAGCGPSDTAPVGPGHLFPAVEGVPVGEGPTLLWVLRPQDYLRCTTGADQVRRFQARYGSEIPVTVLYVGERPEWGRAFLRRHRVNAPLIEVDERRFRRALRGRRSGGVHLLDGGLVRAAATLTDSTELREIFRTPIDSLLADRGGRRHGRHNQPGESP